MRIGVNGLEAAGSLDAVTADVAAAASEGFATYWLPQIFGVDALTALAVAGREVDGIELGTAVVPIQPRHPLMLAAQALTVQAATAGRLALGLGVSHRVVVETMWGSSYEQPVEHLAEYLSALLPLLAGEPVQVSGEWVTAVGTVDVAGVEPPPVLVAALGPRMLRLAGSVGAGTITWCTGPRTLAELTVPTISRSASSAGHPQPRVVASLPICVTSQPQEARELIARELALYGGLPSYRAMLDREGVDGPADIAIVGEEEEVGRRIQALAEIGVTDLAATIIAGDQDRSRTRAFLQSLC